MPRGAAALLLLLLLPLLLPIALLWAARGGGGGAAAAASGAHSAGHTGSSSSSSSSSSSAQCGGVVDARSGRARRETTATPSQAHQHAVRWLGSRQGTCATRLAHLAHGGGGGGGGRSAFSSSAPLLETLRVRRRRRAAEGTPSHAGVGPEAGSPPPSTLSTGLGPGPSRAVYFRGQGDALRLKAEVELPSQEFTAQAWLRPEGGQKAPAVIAGLYDKCSYTTLDRGWVLGINNVSDQGNRDPRYFFSLKTDRARKVTTITDHRSYLPNQWVHLAITYDGHLMKMYVNGAQVSTSREQVGSIFSPLTLKCKVLMLGGNAVNQNYRGYVEHFSLWRTARSQKEILSDMDLVIQEEDAPLPQLIFQETLLNVKRLWSPMKDNPSLPQIEFISHPGYMLDTSLDPPPCGQTVCDNMEVIASYNNLQSFRRKKVVRYRVVNIYDDDHQNPTVSLQQIEYQHQQLKDAFKPYNITWELEVLDVNNSSLRNRLVLANCEISKVGDESCDPECNHTLTGYDGGDCRHVRHSSFNKKKQNGVCDMDCNYDRYNFDGGDCCNPEITDVTKTCFEPDSPHRAYLDVKELKNRLKLDGSTHLNIFFANSSEEELAGMATFPWDKEALVHLGGIVLNPSFYGIAGHTHTMIHEIGHSLGLYHVFKGISEIFSCSDPCMETEPSFETGDLCHDTNPTPMHKVCSDPAPGNDMCGFRTFQNTPFNNFMSYADDDCTNSFTPNQVARMHCYLDLVYQSWQPIQKPAPIAIMPQTVDWKSSSVTLEWFPPINRNFFEREVGSVCDLCTEGRILVQYAFSASSPMPCDPSGHWSPRGAEGQPDVEQPCKPDVRTWSPNSAVIKQTVPPACPEPQGCYLELEFQYPVIPESLTIWVTYVSSDWDAKEAVNDIKLLLVSGRNISLGPQNFFCDVPMTIRLDRKKVNEDVYGIQIYTLDELLEIDAAMMTSVPESRQCANCQPIRYKVTRDPPFQKGSSATVSDLSRKFVDTEVILGSLYTYWVSILSGGEESELSPPLVYIHGSGYCGDGIIQTDFEEECDDMNKVSGDGCSLFCQQELSFKCIDEPSRCYFHDGDGVCEDFEKKTSIVDCGVYTPKGFLDQWASNVTVSHHDERCPGLVVAGQPAADQVCRTKVYDFSDGMSQYAWYPCTANNTHTIFWLKAFFAQPMVAAAVVVHLVTDGTWLHMDLDQKQESVIVQLIDTKNQTHDIGTHSLSCRTNPLVIPVNHDLSQHFYHTQAILITFSSPFVAISGVALRSFHNFDPIIINNCESGQTYSLAEQSCIHYSCKANICEELQIENAVLSFTSKGSFAEAQCNVTCQTGFILRVQRDTKPVKRQTEDSVTMTCVDGRWNKEVLCEPLDCGVPDQYHVYPATFNCSEGTTFGKRCSFTCKPPAQLKGSNNNLTCMEDGLWSFPEALCELMCRAPPVIPNADLQTGRCREGKHKVGAFCKYKCLPGYHVTGSSRKARKRVFKTQCTKDGNWEEKACLPVTCEPPPSKFQGLYQCTNGFQFNSECRIKCKEESQPGRGNVIHCRKDGTWSGLFHLCPGMHGQCTLPTQLSSGVKLQCLDGYGIGAECNILCLDLHKEPILLRPNETIEDIKHWMKPPRVKNVVCTAELKWYPHPTLIHCNKGCEPFMGDNYCDYDNNRAFCSYDGGDCCASTVKTKKVIPFPMLCDLQGACACLDPEAQENKQGDRRELSFG